MNLMMSAIILRLSRLANCLGEVISLRMSVMPLRMVLLCIS